MLCSQQSSFNTIHILKEVLFNERPKEMITLPTQGHYAQFFNVNVTIYIIYELHNGTHFFGDKNKV